MEIEPELSNMYFDGRRRGRYVRYRTCAVVPINGWISFTELVEKVGVGEAELERALYRLVRDGYVTQRVPATLEGATAVALEYARACTDVRKVV